MVLPLDMNVCIMFCLVSCSPCLLSFIKNLLVFCVFVVLNLHTPRVHVILMSADCEDEAVGFEDYSEQTNRILAQDEDERYTVEVFLRFLPLFACFGYENCHFHFRYVTVSCTASLFPFITNYEVEIVCKLKTVSIKCGTLSFREFP